MDARVAQGAPGRLGRVQRCRHGGERLRVDLLLIQCV
jgi:hypothetical protein